MHGLRGTGPFFPCGATGWRVDALRAGLVKQKCFHESEGVYTHSQVPWCYGVGWNHRIAVDRKMDKHRLRDKVLLEFRNESVFG